MPTVAYPRGDRRDPALLETFKQAFGGDWTDVQWQTDKQTAKLVPCTGCGRPLGVNQFYAPAIAKCTGCGGQTETAGKGEAAIVQPGRTDPAKAANLADALLNKQFATAACPLCAEDMELKSVTHNQNYGPTRLVGYTKDGPRYDVSTGETAMLQCNGCKCVVSMSTTAPFVYRRQNEARDSAGDAPVWTSLLGAREKGETADAA
jgi:hypothetical protein